MVESHINRTLICSVVFLDIVEYSRQPVAQQIRLKDLFNSLLSQTLQEIAVTDRIILDTGDGAAISLIGDPEDALFVATGLRDAIAQQPAGDGPRLHVRIGINLGPVRLVRDINGQPNIIGDGINVAQRVMSFAEPGQALASRSYHEVVSCLSDEYSRLFRYEGSRTDKHVRDHEVYAIAETDIARRLRVKSRQAAAAAGATKASVALDHVAQTATLIKSHLRRKPRLTTVLTVIAILAAGIALRGYRGDDQNATEARIAGAATQLPAGSKPAVAAIEPDKAQVADAPAKKAAAGEPALVDFTITPWGEVYIDGKKQGVSPPLTVVRMTAGRHHIEVRNANFPNHLETIDAKAGEHIRIKHKFH